jgi:solute:Na+ symporter, SSS family
MLSFGPPEPAGEVLLPFLVIIGLQWFFQMNSDGTGYLAQRSMACRTDRDARSAGVVFAWAQILFRSLLWLAIAVGLLVLYPFAPAERAPGFAASREILFVTGIRRPAAARDPRADADVGLLAALASTIDTHLNWGASYWSNDVYDRLVCRHWLRPRAAGRELVVVARLSNLLILAIALVIMANLGSIQTAWFISLLFGAGMGSVLVLRWLWERINLYSELAAMASSSSTCHRRSPCRAGRDRGGPSREQSAPARRLRADARDRRPSRPRSRPGRATPDDLRGGRGPAPSSRPGRRRVAGAGGDRQGRRRASGQAAPPA